MKDRCNNPRNRKIYYGVSYDPTWERFEQFLADMGERPAGTTLDRKDGSKGYSKDNCRWATPDVQNRNRVINVRINGEMLADIAVRLGLKYQTAYWRLNNGRLILDGKVARRDPPPW